MIPKQGISNFEAKLERLEEETIPNEVEVKEHDATNIAVQAQNTDKKM